MTRIIDFHIHLGDIFHENKNITFKTNLKKLEYEDRFLEIEESGYTKPIVVKDEDDMQVLIDSGQGRCWEATLEKFSAEMDACGYTYACALPILPNTSFEEYLAASKLDPRIIPFTSADFTMSIPEMEKKLKKDIERGAKGLKLHPIIQNISLEDDRVSAATEVFGQAGLPINTHVGVTSYYGRKSPWFTHQNVEYGKYEAFYEYARRWPKYTIVGAHRVTSIDDFAKNMADLENVYTDTSTSPAQNMKKSVELLGPDRILFATDWPFCSLKVSRNLLIEALGDDPDVLDKVFYRNAARILKLEE